MLDRVKEFLSFRTVSIAIIFIAIVSRVVQLLFFYNLGEDLAYQVLASQNFANGNGITLAKAMPYDLSATTYEALIKWPPGYSLFMYPVYEIFQHHYVLASLFVEILAAISLIIYSRKILFLLQLPVYLVNTYTLVTAFFIHVFYVFPSTDGIAISLYIVALYHSLKIAVNGKSLWKSFVVIVCLIAAAMLKYLFVPLVFTIPLFFLYKGFKEKRIFLTKLGTMIIVVLIASIALMLLYQKSVSGSIAYVRSSGLGFFPEHILSSYPFVPASFIKQDTIPVLTGISSDLVYKMLQILHVILLVHLITNFIKVSRTKTLNTRDVSYCFILLVISVSIVTFFSLMILSLLITTDKISSGSWTFLQDARYYGLAIVLTQFAFFLFLLHFNYYRLLKKSIIAFLMIMFVVEMLRGAGFVSKRVMHSSKEEYSWQHDIRFQQIASELIEKEKKSTGIQQVVITGSEYVNNRISLKNNVPRLYADTLINNISLLHTKKPVLLVAVIQDIARERFAAFLNNKEISEMGRFENCSFYSLIVEPN